jgi:hypothetical protein
MTTDFRSFQAVRRNGKCRLQHPHRFAPYRWVSSRILGCGVVDGDVSFLVGILGEFFYYDTSYLFFNSVSELPLFPGSSAVLACCDVGDDAAGDDDEDLVYV